jgi:hypothetical protein
MGVLDPEYSAPVSQTPMTSVTKQAIGSVALSAVSSWNSFQMDKINSQMAQDAAQFQRDTLTELRKQQGWAYGVNKEKLKQSLASERLAMDVTQMQELGAARNAAAAANVSNASGISRDIERAQMRADLYQDRAELDKLQALKVQSLDSQSAPKVIYDAPKPDLAGSLAQFGISAVSIGQAAYGEFTPQTKQG